MKRYEYESECPICGEVFTIGIDVADDVAEKIDSGIMTLKEATEPGTFDREVFISGMCYDCQEKTFNRPAPGHEEEWGKCAGECPVCGCPIYDKNLADDKCPQCHCTISAEGGVITE